MVDLGLAVALALTHLARQVPLGLRAVVCDAAAAWGEGNAYMSPAPLPALCLLPCHVGGRSPRGRSARLCVSVCARVRV